jgi:SAM-dependent methyltransferase
MISTVVRDRSWVGRLRGARAAGNRVSPVSETRAPDRDVAVGRRRPARFRRDCGRDAVLTGILETRVLKASPDSYYRYMIPKTTPSAPDCPSRTSAAGPVPHACPWWLGPILASPLRKLFESPERLLRPYVRPGMTVVEPGCGMGFFTLPLARLVGPNGRIVCLDLQSRMIDGLRRRARRAGLLARIQASVCTADDVGLHALAGSADLAVALHMLHEVPDRARLLSQLNAALRPGGLLLLVEPKGHVSPEDFANTLAIASRAGFTSAGQTLGGRALSAVLTKPGGPS